MRNDLTFLQIVLLALGISMGALAERTPSGFQPTGRYSTAACLAEAERLDSPDRLQNADRQRKAASQIVPGTPALG